MKVILFCGGRGTRIRQASELLPKPLIPVCNLPIILRLMAQYSAVGANDFILATGHLSGVIENYFEKLLQVNPENKKIEAFLIEKYFCAPFENWNIKIEDTGDCNIGTRLFKLKHLLHKEDYFFANYSDSVSSININESLLSLKGTSCVASIAAVKPSHYYHWLNYDANQAREPNTFTVKSIENSSKLSHRINGGYMCLSSEIFEYLNYGEELVEQPFQRLAQENRLVCYQTDSYWRSIDTYKDLQEAEGELGELSYDN